MAVLELELLMPISLKFDRSVIAFLCFIPFRIAGLFYNLQAGDEFIFR